MHWRWHEPSSSCSWTMTSCQFPTLSRYIKRPPPGLKPLGDRWPDYSAWQEPSRIEPPRALKGLRTDFDFPFHSTIEADVQNAMAGNLCVNRAKALSIGGFDETFVGSAYRFETEFAKRIINAGGRIRFLGSAGLLHLKASAGGTRRAGSHLTSASPSHGFGDYYYAFRHGTTTEAWLYSAHRMIREVRTRFHLRHPWWIPVKLLGEFRAMSAGFRAAKFSRRPGDR